MQERQIPRLIYRVELPGGQIRLREAALYVMKKCENLHFFGLTKLNKILWKADFSAFAARRVPVTGRQYQRLQNGPAPVEMKPLLDDMLLDQLIRIDERRQGGYTERRPIALVDPTLRYFSPDDVNFLDNAVENFQSHTGREVSASSHGVAWLTRKNGDPMPYDLALLSDNRLTAAEEERFLSLGEGRLWRTN